MGCIDVDGNFHVGDALIFLTRMAVCHVQIADLVVKFLQAQVAFLVREHNDIPPSFQVIQTMSRLDARFIVVLDDPPLDLAKCLNQKGKSPILISQF